MRNPLRFTPIFSRRKKDWAGILALLIWLLPQWGHAQNRADAYGFTQSIGVYTPITGTDLSLSNNNYNDIVYPASALPFTFTYAGVGYTSLRVSSNGFITFGTTAPGPYEYYPLSSNAAYSGAISAFGLDCFGTPGASAVSTSIEGTAPNREFVVQYANWTSRGIGLVNFQIRLAETSNVIRIVYGPFDSTSSRIEPQVGLRGAVNTDFNNRTSTMGWGFTNMGTSLTNSSGLAVPVTSFFGGPTPGLTFTYTPSTTPQLPAIRPTASVVTANAATISLRGPVTGVSNPVNSYTATVTPAVAGSPFTVTGSSFTIGGLTANTPYTVSVVANYTAGISLPTEAWLITSPPCTPPTYASVPYMETFENTWVSNCALRDVPSLNWKLTPGVDRSASFRRYDDGESAGWSLGLSYNGEYTPAGSDAGGASSSFSARFHSSKVFTLTSALFDLYANVSGGTGTPVLTFDYINTQGTDKLEVLLSTDGGTTFGAPLYTQVTNSGWTTYRLSLPSATATSVIRFRATGDNTTSDIGLDNVGISYAACAAPSAVAVPAATITSTTAQVTFAPASGATSYTVTTSPATPQAPATASPTTLTGLAPGTAYTVVLTSNCGSAATTNPVAFNTANACSTPTYASVPYRQTFEGTWVSSCAMRDVPSLNWKMTPGREPDASFRRCDDGATAGWTYGSISGYGPTGSNANGANSYFSARYHSGYVLSATESALFDLYANVSGGTGTPVLTFDYINTGGNDKLEVLLSTDGGATFSAPLFTQFTNSGWTTYAVALTGATATSVIRFRASGNDAYDHNDIGLDNVDISYVACTPAAAVAVPTITPTTAQVTFTALTNSVTSYTVTTSPATPQGPATASPITLTGLTPGTTYSVTLTANCAGSTSTITYPVTFTTPFVCTTPTYATVPYTQTFENNWITNCGVRDVPSQNWKQTPGRDPSASFRRYDDGAAANWAAPAFYGYLPEGSDAGGASSLFSARLHSSCIYSSGINVALFDLYANISGGTGTPMLQFDYVNTSGTDRLEVLLSTNGGATFSAPLFTQVVSANWTTYTVPLTGATATSVIRFRAANLIPYLDTSDMGIDNVNVRYTTVSATTAALMAAGVSVYPNPAHEGFTVSMAAVPNAPRVQAELLNTLGQIVRMQSAALPAAGAHLEVPTADLAAGVYTLRLRAGDATLTKRIVIN